MKNDNEVRFSCRRKKVRDTEKYLENSCEMPQQSMRMICLLENDRVHDKTGQK